MPDDPQTFTFDDELGSRTLVVPTTELPWTGDPISIVRDIEARTRTRLREGGNPIWFIRLHKHFTERRDPVDGVSFAEYVTRRHSDKIDVLMDEARKPQHVDMPVFPLEPDEVKASQFRVIEPSDMQSRQDIEALMRLMWQERECAFFYYLPKNGPGSAALAQARDSGELLMDEMKRRYYRHPRYDRDYLQILERNGSYRWPWEKEVVEKGPEYWQVRLQLSARKIAEFDAMYKIQLEEQHLRKARSARNLTRMVQPIHFEDFDGHQFERLAFAYHLRTEKWRTLEWYGQSGSDLGRDIWGERATGGSLCIQCVNRRTVAARKLTRDLDKIVRARGGIPDGVLVVCASTVSAKLRDKVKEHAQKKGIAQCDIWSGHEFEERLRRDAESLLRRFIEGETFPDDPEELLRFTGKPFGVRPRF